MYHFTLLVDTRKLDDGKRGLSGGPLHDIPVSERSEFIGGGFG